LYEDEFELTFNLSGEEPQPEQAAQEPPAAPEPKAEPAAAAVDEPTRVMVLEKPAPQPVPEPETPEPPQEPEKPAAEEAAAARPSAGNGRGVLISGGDRGIGAAAARAFYEAGFRVAVLYHSNAEAAAALEKQLPGITAVQCDVASRASCELAFRTAEQALGHVDVLVSNAGIAQQKLFTDITPEEWQHMLDVNLTGAFHLCQLALPHDPPQGRTHPDGEQHVGPDRRQLRGALLRSKGGPDRPDQGFGQRRRPQRHYSELCCARGHRYRYDGSVHRRG